MEDLATTAARELYRQRMRHLNRLLAEHGRAALQASGGEVNAAAPILVQRMAADPEIDRRYQALAEFAPQLGVPSVGRPSSSSPPRKSKPRAKSSGRARRRATAKRTQKASRSPKA